VTRRMMRQDNLIFWVIRKIKMLSSRSISSHG
jgi:hypothetical protein